MSSENPTGKRGRLPSSPERGDGSHHLSTKKQKAQDDGATTLGPEHQPPTGEQQRLLNAANLPLVKESKPGSVRLAVHRISTGQSGATVEEWTVHGEHVHGDAPEGLAIISKRVPSEAKLREPKFYLSSLYQEYVEKSRARGGCPITVHHVETAVEGAYIRKLDHDDEVLNALEEDEKSNFSMLMEKGGLMYPGGPEVYDIPEEAGEGPRDAAECPAAAPEQWELRRRREFAQQWAGVVVDELAVLHGTFWRRAELHPAGFWGSVARALLDAARRRRTLGGAVAAQFNVADKDPTPKIEKFPYLTGLGMLSIFEPLRTDVGLVKGPKLWSLEQAPFRSALLAAAPKDPRYGTLVKIGDHLAETLGEGSGAYTLVHNDMKYENILLRYHPRTGKEVAQLFDFDLVGAGTGPADLATFVITSLDMEARMENLLEDRLLERYCLQVWAAMPGTVRREHYADDFAGSFRPEVRRDYFRKAAQTVFVMNMLQAQGEKAFYRLLDRTLSWFQCHRHDFGISFLIPDACPHYIAVDIVDQSDSNKLHRGILLDTAQLERRDFEETAEQQAGLKEVGDAGLNYALLCISLGRTQRKAGRIYTPDGQPMKTSGFASGRELLAWLRKAMIEACIHGDEEKRVVPRLTVTDGSLFKYAHGDHESYQFGDLLLRPAARRVDRMLSPFTGCFGFGGGGPRQLDVPTVGLYASRALLTTDFAAQFPRLVRSYNREDKIIKLQVLNDVFYVVANPHMALELFQQPDKRVPTTCFGDLPTMASKGVFIADGQMWHLGRGCFEQNLRPQLIKSLTEYFASNCQRMIDAVDRHLQKGEGGSTCQGREHGTGVVEMLDWVERVTYDSMSEVGFGYKPDMVGKHGSGETDPFIKTFDECLEISLRSMVDWKALYPLYHGKATLKAKMKQLNGFIDTEIIHQAREALARRDHDIRHARFHVGDVVTVAGPGREGKEFRVAAVESEEGNTYRLADAAAGGQADAGSQGARTCAGAGAEEGDTFVCAGSEVERLVAAAKPPPLLNFLLDERCPVSKMGFGDDTIRDQVITMLVAGHKTTTLLLIWCLFHLARDVHWQTVLVNELKRVFGADQTGFPSEAQIGRLEKMHLFLHEVLRLACPVQTVQRGLSHEATVKVPGTDRQYTLKPHGRDGQSGNSWIFVHLWGMHHDEDFWGESAMEFDPGRFEPERRAKWALGDVQFNPFGGGRRACLGNLFAVQQAKTVLVMMLRKWTIDVARDRRNREIEVKIDPDDIASPLSEKRARERGKGEAGGVYLRLHPRDEWASLVPKDDELKRMPSLDMTSLYAAAEQSSQKRFQELVVIWGGQFGTTQREAEQIAAEARKLYSRGCRVLEGNAIFGPAKKDETLQKLKEFLDTLGDDPLLVFLTPVYNREPAPNMVKLFRVLKEAGAKAERLGELSEYCAEGGPKSIGLRFAVLAIGNRNWTSTFTAAGRELDQLLGNAWEHHLPLQVLDRDDPAAAYSLQLWKRELCAAGDLWAPDAAPAAAADPGPAHLRAEPPPRYVSFEGDERVACADAERLGRAAAAVPLMCKNLGYSIGQVVGNDELVELEQRPERGTEALRSVKDLAVMLPGIQELTLEEDTVLLLRASEESGCRVTGTVLRRLPDGRCVVQRHDGCEDECEVGAAECLPIAYEPGDHLQVLTEQSDADVQALCELLGYAPDAVVVPSSSREASQQEEKGREALGRELRVADVLKHYVDVSKAPSQSAVAGFLEYSNLPDPQVRRLREELLVVPRPGAGAGAAESAFDTWKQQHRLTFLEALQHFEVKDLPLARLVELAPPQVPRLYSIASAPAPAAALAAGVQVKLCLGVAHSGLALPAGETKYFTGLCSGTLSRKTVAPPGPGAATGSQSEDAAAPSVPSPRSPHTIFCKLKRHEHMRLPVRGDAPMMMVATGTGIAPFLSFLEERGRLPEAKCGPGAGGAAGAPAGPETPRNTLYFGVRGSYDVLKLGYLSDLAARGMLRAEVAYSRGAGPQGSTDPGAGKVRIQNQVYVTDLIARDAEDVRRFFTESEDSVFYICGSVKMSMGVMEELRKILGAEAVLALQQDAHRIVLDVWG